MEVLRNILHLLEMCEVKEVIFFYTYNQGSTDKALLLLTTIIDDVTIDDVMIYWRNNIMIHNYESLKINEKSFEKNLKK